MNEKEAVLFRGGPMDGRRAQFDVLSSFIDVPTERGGSIRYRMAEKISDKLTIYELDTDRH